MDKIITQQSRLLTVGHPSADKVGEKIELLKKLLESLFTQLEECVSTVGELDVLLGECNRRLKDCERWLVAHGKFAENEIIIEQMKEHQVCLLSEWLFLVLCTWLVQELLYIIIAEQSEATSCGSKWSVVLISEML